MHRRSHEENLQRQLVILMGYCVIKLDGKYLEWSSISDSPRSYLLPKELFSRYWREQYGIQRIGELKKVLKDTDEKGTNSLMSKSAEEVIKDNHAGKGGKSLTKKQIIDEYTLTDVAEFEQWIKAREKDEIDFWEKHS